MREPIKDYGRLLHMIEMARSLEIEKGKYNIEDIRNDRVLFYGLSKMVEIIGEAAYMTTKEYKCNNPQIPWRQIEGMRHILVHGYFSISADVLWDVIENDIPKLLPDLENCIKNFEDNNRDNISRLNI